MAKKIPSALARQANKVEAGAVLRTASGRFKPAKKLPAKGK